MSAPAEWFGMANTASSSSSVFSPNKHAQTVRVVDSLLNVTLNVKLHQEATFLDLKQKLQSAQVSTSHIIFFASLVLFLYLTLELCVARPAGSGRNPHYSLPISTYPRAWVRAVPRLYTLLVFDRPVEENHVLYFAVAPCLNQGWLISSRQCGSQPRIHGQRDIACILFEKFRQFMMVLCITS